LFLPLAAATGAHAQTSVTLQWDRNQDTGTAGYRLYYGTSSGSYQWSVDAGSQTSVGVSLGIGRYYFVVRAYNSNYQYSPPSSEVSYSVGTTTASSVRANINAVLLTSTSALVSWLASNAVSATLNGTAVALSGSGQFPISGTTTTFTLVARNVSGSTASASATVSLLAPLPPVNLSAAVSGTRVTLAWQRNPLAGAPTNYLVDVSRADGSSVVNDQPTGNVLSVVLTLPPGSYSARVGAVNAYGQSLMSSRVSFTVRSF
jgi:hypothetical protein